MSTYPDRLAAIRDGHRAADREHPDHRDGWREARHAIYVRTLADAAGVDLDQLDDDEARAVEWLTGWDAETVAGVAALLDRAREGRP